MNITRKNIVNSTALFLLATLSFAANSNAQEVNPDDYDNIGDAFLAQSQLEQDRQNAKEKNEINKKPSSKENVKKAHAKAAESGNRKSAGKSKSSRKLEPLVIDPDGVLEYDSRKAIDIWKNATKDTWSEANKKILELVPPPDTPYFWKSQPPKDCPFPASDDFDGIIVTGRGRGYDGYENTIPQWADDGNLYTMAADAHGILDPADGPLKERLPDPDDKSKFYSPKLLEDGTYKIKLGTRGYETRTGNVIIRGENPLELDFKVAYRPYVINGIKHPTAAGAYPSATLVHKGVWYMSNYGLYNYRKFGSKIQKPEDYPHAKEFVVPVPSPTHGPYVVVPGGVLTGMTCFRHSKDYGRSWVPGPRSDGTPQDPDSHPWDLAYLFPEERVVKKDSGHITSPDDYSGAVKFGTPHFVDFGKDMEHSPDGKAYLVGHGGPADPNKYRAGDVSWMSGDQIHLARVTLDPEKPEVINDLKSWEFFGGHDSEGKPVWTSDFQKTKPLLEWDDNMGGVNMTYNAALKKYLMFVTSGWPTKWNHRNLTILEADKIEGPWKLVTFMRAFGPVAYFQTSLPLGSFPGTKLANLRCHLNLSTDEMVPGKPAWVPSRFSWQILLIEAISCYGIKMSDFVNAPSKFISDDGKNMWIFYGNNYSEPTKLPRQGNYGCAAVEVRLREKKK